MAEEQAKTQESLPHSGDAEMGLLSCFLQNPTLLLDAKDKLPEGAFYHPIYKQIYGEMQELIMTGRPLDLVTFSQHLLDKGLMEKIGGVAFLTELLSFIPTPEHYNHYKSILLDKLLLRKGIEAGSSTIQACYDYQDDLNKVADVIGSSLSAVGDAIRNRIPRKTWEEKVDEIATDWTQRYLGKTRSTVDSPWDSWNKTLGGLRVGYNLILGPRKTGKSSLCGHKTLALSVLPSRQERVKSMVFTYETRASDYTLRLASNLSGVRGDCIFQPDIDPPNDREQRKIADAFTSLAIAPIEVVDATGMTVIDMEREAKRFGAWYIVVDYLMLIPWLPNSNQKEGTEGRIRTNSNALIQMSRNLNASVDVINHTVTSGDREGESRWSDQPENDCDLCLLIDKNGIKVKSSRNGKSGGQLPIFFYGETYAFKEGIKLPT